MTDAPPDPSRAALPPGPSGGGLMGSLAEGRADPVAFTSRLSREYGGVASARMGNLTMTLVSDPDAVRAVFLAPDLFQRRTRDHAWLRELLGRGLVTSEGEAWAAHRRVLMPAYKEAAGEAAVPALLDETRQVVEALTGRAGDHVRVSHELVRLGILGICRVYLGIDPGPDAARMADALEQTSGFLEENIYQAIPLPLWVPTARNRRFRQEVEAMDAFGARALEEGAGPLAEALRQGLAEGLPRRWALDEVRTALAAGAETTAHGTAWALALLARHHDWRARVEEEADAFTGNLDSLEVIPRVFEETLRLYPPVWTLSRRPAQDTLLGGFRVRAGHPVVLSSYSTHRLPGHWPDPERFDPDRFLPDARRGRHPVAYWPFGLGPHRCVGAATGMRQACLTLATFSRTLRVELEAEGMPRPEARLTLRPAGGLHARLVAR